MRKLLLALTMTTIIMSFAPLPDHSPPAESSNQSVIKKEVVSPVPVAPFRMFVRNCGYADWNAAVVGAGHMEWQLQQQGYGNFYVEIDCDGDLCWQMCYTVFYSWASLKLPEDGAENADGTLEPFKSGILVVPVKKTTAGDNDDGVTRKKI